MRSLPPSAIRSLTCGERTVALLIGLLAALMPAGRAAGAEPSAAGQTSMRLTLSWGDGTRRQWSGTVSLNRGHLSQASTLGVEADQVATAWVEQGRLHIRERLPKTYDGVEFLAEGPSDAMLQIRLHAADDAATSAVADVPLAALRNGPAEWHMDDLGNRMVVRRAPTDLLRVRLARDQLVFSPGETFSFQLTPHDLPVEAGTQIDVLLELCRARSQESLWSAEHPVTAGESVSTRHDIPLPEIEGVYELSITASYNPGLNWHNVTRPAWNWRKTLAARRIQCVVLSPEPPEVATGVDTGLHLLESLDPTDPAGWRERWERWTTLPRTLPDLPRRFPGLSGRLPQNFPRLSETMPRLGQAVAPLQAPFQGGLPRLTEGVSRLGENFAPWGAADQRVARWNARGHVASLSSWVNPWDEPTFGNGHLQPYKGLPRGLMELDPRTAGGDYPWQAYFLPIQNPGRPHVLEIEYLDVPQTLAVSIVEPNPLGAVLPPTLDFGIDVPEPLVTIDPPKVPAVKTYRIVFWPQTESPLILIANRRNDAPARFGKIRLYGGWDRLPRRFPPGGRPGRLAAAYLDRPLFPENFSASQTVGELSRICVDDWVTFHEAGTRLVEYLDHAGYGGLMMSVWSDGSAIYPSRVLESTAVYDSGVFLGSARDPVRKDVVEMLLRLFDRQGLELVPALDFCAPLPQLEALARRGGPEAVGIRPIGPGGQSWFAEAADRPSKLPPLRAAYYNLLDPRVQEAMLSVVREFVSRYKDHRSLQGIALQLSSDGYALLPGPEWGLDDATIARFERETGIAVPVTGPARFAARARFLESNCPRQWLTWRAAQVRHFYAKLQQAIAAERPDLKLYLAGGGMLSGETTQDHLRPRLSQEMTLREAMLRLGIDPALYDDPGIVLLRPERVAPRWSLTGEAVMLETARLSDYDSAFFQKGGLSGALFHHGLAPIRLASFESMSPYTPTHAWIAPDAYASEDAERRRFVHALAAIDAQVVFDGGREIRTEQNDALVPWLAAFRSLPPLSFEPLEADTEDSSQPVCVRFARGIDGTYAYLVNDAPFPVEATVRIAAKPGCRVDEISGLRVVEPPKVDKLGAYWTVDLEPYDLVAVRLSDPAARLYQVRAEIPAEARRQIEARIVELSGRIAASRSLEMPIAGLANADFEAEIVSGRPVPPGWSSRGWPSAEFTAEVEMSIARSGRQSLRLISTNEGGSVWSRPMTCPPTGRLALLAWVGVPAGRADSVPLRFAVQDATAGTTLAHAAFRETLPPTTTVSQGEVLWRRVLVPLPELPLDPERAIQLRFDLEGPATVWIDQVEIYGLYFTRTERNKIIELVGLADYSLRKGKIADSIRFLESYWPRFFLAYVPRVEGWADTPREPRREADVAQPPAEDENIGFFGRMRSYIPSSLRFF